MSLKTAPPQLTAADAELRGQYLREVLALLYPHCSTDDPSSPKVAEYFVIPDARRPSLLVPVASRRVAAAAVRRYAEPQSRPAKLKRDAVVMALRTGASARAAARPGPADRRRSARASTATFARCWPRICR